MPYSHDHIRTRLDNGVFYATFDNPPVNIITQDLFRELLSLTGELERDDDVRVVVFESANPEFFLAHFDVELLIAAPADRKPSRQTTLGPYHVMCERVRLMPKATIAKIAGRVGGGGSEFASSCDMRFGASGQTKVCQMEVALGILPGGTGTQRLPRLMGRGRALEIILGSDDIDSETAERWGYLNRALPPAELDGFVDDLARRIAAFPPFAVALAKQSILNVEGEELEGLLDEAFLFQRTMAEPQSKRNMQAFMDAGGQTREGELRVGALGFEAAQKALTA
ncbi:MAG TPA: enoyl-CoA hydratase/isomerase family protein [Dehalococcoidia bacterium]|nr:enoyl-CoA hydratase/isomerase family protein [Dehalococcoidia bacterium]